MEKEYILGMDIGGTNFRLGLVDQSYCAREVKVFSSASVYGSGNTVEQFAACIRRYLDTYADGKRIAAIGIGCPSVVDAQRRRLYSSTNFPGLEDIDLVEELEKRLNYKVYIEHDAYYLLASDIRKYGLDTAGTIIGCYFGTGLGAAMYIGGKPYIGKNGTACELGHLPVPMNDYPCSCGNQGCIEMFSCGKALERIGKTYYPEDFIGDLFALHAEEPVLRDFVEYMSVPVAAMANIMDPHHMILGGGLLQMKGFPREYLRERVLAHTRKPYPAANLDLIFADGEAEKGIVGAAIRIFEELGR
ncbi:MAG: allose kinase [Lachnospiraceae bacterium]|nr:allose kinase [Lachnospiraceae bacterium]